ncbi:hypothetical protein SRHO_G00139200 [Serrasalmus rhombeus]
MSKKSRYLVGELCLAPPVLLHMLLFEAVAGIGLLGGSLWSRPFNPKSLPVSPLVASFPNQRGQQAAHTGERLTTLHRFLVHVPVRSTSQVGPARFTIITTSKPKPKPSQTSEKT